MEGPVYKREHIKLGNSITKQVGVNMDWGFDVAKNAMFRSVSLFIKMYGISINLVPILTLIVIFIYFDIIF